MVYVLGSINQDYMFVLPRVPKKGETLSADAYFCSLGGKGANQAVAVARLGGRAALLARAGVDGKELINRLEGFNVKTDYIVTDEQVPTGKAVIMVCGGDNRIIIEGGANSRLKAEDYTAALSDAKTGGVALCQLEIPQAEAVKFFELAKKQGMTTVLNPAPAAQLSDRFYSLTDIIVPNETETQILTGINPDGSEGVRAAAARFFDRGIKRGVITLGARGAACFENGNITHIPPRKVKAVDTTAAGDTFVGALCINLDKGLVNACQIASAAASITVTRRGAAESIPDMDEVLVVMKNNGAAK